MSAVDKKNIQYLKNRNIECFYCYKPIIDDVNDFYCNHEDFYIEWRNNPEIYLHPKCAIELAVHFIKDVRSGEREDVFNYGDL